LETEGFCPASESEQSGAARSGACQFADATDAEVATVEFSNGGETGGTAVFFGLLENERIAHGTGGNEGNNDKV
jgi:hypothetical protein